MRLVELLSDAKCVVGSPLCCQGNVLCGPEAEVADKLGDDEVDHHLLVLQPQRLGQLRVQLGRLAHRLLPERAGQGREREIYVNSCCLSCQITLVLCCVCLIACI